MRNTIKFPPGMYQRIRELAERDRRSIHAQVLSLVEEALVARGIPREEVAAPPPLPSARAWDARPGQKPGMSDEDVATGKQMRADGFTWDEVAAHFGVHRVTAWKYIGPDGRGVVLTEDQAREIRRRVEPQPDGSGGESGAALAREFGVSAATISHIKNGQSWRDATAEPAGAS